MRLASLTAALLWIASASAQTTANEAAPAKAAPAKTAAAPHPVTVDQAERIRTGDTPAGAGRSEAGEGVYGTATTPGSMAAHATEATPKGQPPQ